MMMAAALVTKRAAVAAMMRMRFVMDVPRFAEFYHLPMPFQVGWRYQRPPPNKLETHYEHVSPSTSCSVTSNHCYSVHRDRSAASAGNRHQRTAADDQCFNESNSRQFPLPLDRPRQHGR